MKIGLQSQALNASQDREWLRFTLIQQVPTAVLCALMLDGGTTGRVCLSAMAGYWLGVAWLQLRRPQRPARTDVAFERWGFFPLLIASGAIASFWIR